MKNLFASLLLVASIAIIPGSNAQATQRGVSIALNPSVAKSWGAYYALIIGINKYTEWPALKTAVKDATVIRDTLVSRYGFDKQNVILRVDAEASRLQIIEDLRYLALSMGEHDNLLVYYAGHGQLDDLTGDGYWVPAEGRLKQSGTWVANSYIKAVLSSEKVKAKNVVVIADSCYSGTMLRGGPSLMSLKDQRYREKLVEKAALRSRQVISSGGVEPVADGGAEGHSLFAYYLTDALRKNDREVIDLENLFHTRVWKPVTEIGNQRPNVGRLKTPMDQDGQFVLYNAAWVDEKTRKQIAMEAKKQKKAQLAAVASAELELQQQRIAMEKEKLAYERKQLDERKALEMEKLKIEQQKQAIEYAKLQNQIEKMKERQNNTPLITASVSPSDLGKESADNQKAKQRNYSKPPSNLRHAIAIFPANSNGNNETYANQAHEVVYRSVFEAVKSFAYRKPEFALRYSYYPGYSALDRENIERLGIEVIDIKFDDESLKKLWAKKTIFAPYEPDIDTVAELSRTINADIIVMYRYAWESRQLDRQPFFVYLIDTNNNKMYVTTEIDSLDTASPKLKDITNSLLEVKKLRSSQTV